MMTTNNAIYHDLLTLRTTEGKCLLALQKNLFYSIQQKIYFFE